VVGQDQVPVVQRLIWEVAIQNKYSHLRKKKVNALVVAQVAIQEVIQVTLVTMVTLVTVVIMEEKPTPEAKEVKTEEP